MHKNLKIFSLLFIFTLLLAGCGPSSGTDSIDNLVTNVTQTILVDSNGSHLIGDKGDEELTAEKAKSDAGLEFTVAILDSNGNGTIELGETTHAVISIINTSDDDYTIQQVHLEARLPFIEYDDSFTNIQTDNTGDVVYTFDQNNMDSGSAFHDFTLDSGDTATYEFDITWPNDEDTKKDLVPGTEADEYFEFNFAAYTEEGHVMYFSLDGIELPFSGEVL